MAHTSTPHLAGRPCNVGKAFDFGYIGEFESEYFACEELSTRPHSSLLTSVADPQQRIEVVESFEPMPSYESVARGAVPINETQYDIIAGLHRSIECVQGPPGTGKSTTIFHIINSRLPEGTVALATCVQNKAVDAIADKLEDRVPFFVYGREDRLGLVSKRNTISGQIERHPEVVTLTRLINNVRRFQQEVVNEAKKRLKESADKLYSDKRSRQRQVRANAKYPHGSLDYQEKRDTFMARDMWKFAWEKILARRHGTLFTTAKRLFEIENHAACLRSRLKSELRETIVGSARAILCTVASTGSLIHCEELFAATSRITTAVLDEAGTSPEAKLPVLLLNPCLDKIIAIGDQQQLAPFTHLDDPVKNVCFQFQKHGFCSYGNFCKFMHGSGEPLPDGFFQRAEKSLGSIPILTEQYRMHPDICQVVSTLFYDNQLTTNPLVSVRRRHASARGLFWSQSNSFESKAPNSSSTQNLGEAKQVLKVYNQVAKSMAPDQTIMVITFYKAQLHALKDEFRSNMIEETPALRLVTVDQSQGSEADFVILSTVRSGRSIGFLSNCNRLNVAISRAREQLICVGNKLTLMTSPEWNKVIQACHPFEL